MCRLCWQQKLKLFDFWPRRVNSTQTKTNITLNYTREEYMAWFGLDWCCWWILPGYGDTGVVFGFRIFCLQDCPHWQYQVKQCETRRSRLCYNGSKRAAPKLHEVAKTWSSCLEQPVQRLFLALCAIQGFQIYGAGVCDAFAHALADTNTYILAIDDAYIDWSKKVLG